jgi:hypothetical protein
VAAATAGLVDLAERANQACSGLFVNYVRLL